MDVHFGRLCATVQWQKALKWKSTDGHLGYFACIDSSPLLHSFTSIYLIYSLWSEREKGTEIWTYKLVFDPKRGLLLVVCPLFLIGHCAMRTVTTMAVLYALCAFVWPNSGEWLSNSGKPNLGDLLDCEVFFPRTGMRSQLLAREGRHGQKSVPFKLWIQWAIDSGKTVRIYVRENQLIRPVLQYLHSVSRRLSQLIVHADLFRDNCGKQLSLDPQLFVKLVDELVPNAFISIGWTSPIDETKPCVEKYTWSKVFQMLRLTYELPQAVIYSLSLRKALQSIEELHWLLNCRSGSYAVVGEEDHQWLLNGAELNTVLQLGRFGLKLNMLGKVQKKNYGAMLTHSSWPKSLAQKQSRRASDNRFADQWKIENFKHPNVGLARIVNVGNDVALLGWPSGFLTPVEKSDSDVKRVRYANWQSLSGRLVLARREQANFSCADPSLAVHLAIILGNSTYKPVSPSVDGDYRLLINVCDGRVSVENIHLVGGNWSTQCAAFTSASVLHSRECYDFFLIDRQAEVEFTVDAVPCSKPAPGDSTTPTWWPWISRQAVRLRLPKPNIQSSDEHPQRQTTASLLHHRRRHRRTLYIQKHGDDSIDLLIQHLQYISAASSEHRSAVLILLLLCFFFAYKGVVVIL
ncbi:hypothetical protein T03_6796 [Trichinella britovi]|uniref:Uncharacterized protein n=1 Tax=Trichinella britovi TaxID=45882 RepID=A0A0V1CY16_TRIBR|nr:hypothetical protein T03_6796 [Trichinella britovi]